MKLSIVAGATSQSINVFIRDSSSTTGAGLSGLVFNTASLAAYYSFTGANATAVSISLATLSLVTSAWATGGFIEIDSVHMKGWYRLDLPNAVLAASSGRVVSLHLYGATNMAPCPVEIELTGWNNQDAVHGGMSAIPNTACTTNASLLTSGTGTDQISVSAGKTLLQATQTGVVIPTVTTVTNQLTAAAIATGIWQDTTAGDFTAASSIGKSLYTSGAVPGSAGGHFIAGTNAATTVTTSFTTTFTGNLTGSVGSLTTNNDKTGYSLTTAPPTAAAVATAVWTDATSSDFTTTSSPGKILVTQLGGAFSTTSSSIYSTASLANAPTGGSAPTTAQIATAVWTDLLASSDFSTASSVGALVKANVGGDTSGTTTLLARVTALRSGYLDNLSAGAVALASGVVVTTNNDKAGYSLTQAFPSNFAALALTAGGKVSGVVLADTVTTYTGNTVQTGDAYARLGAAGAGLTALGDTRIANLDAAVSSRSTYAGGAVASVTASVTVGTNSDKTGYSLNLGQTGYAPRNLGSIADAALTTGDLLVAAGSGAAGKETVVGTAYTVMTPSTGTTVRVFTLDSSTSPASRT